MEEDYPGSYDNDDHDDGAHDDGNHDIFTNNNDNNKDTDADNDNNSKQQHLHHRHQISQGKDLTHMSDHTKIIRKDGSNDLGVSDSSSSISNDHKRISKAVDKEVVKDMLVS